MKLLELEEDRAAWDVPPRWAFDQPPFEYWFHMSSPSPSSEESLPPAYVDLCGRFSRVEFVLPSLLHLWKEEDLLRRQEDTDMPLLDGDGSNFVSPDLNLTLGDGDDSNRS